jgi:hypothetical protein
MGDSAERALGDGAGGVVGVISIIADSAEIIVVTFVVHAEIVGIKFYMISYAIGYVAIITNMPGNNIGVVDGCCCASGYARVGHALPARLHQPGDRGVDLCAMPRIVRVIRHLRHHPAGTAGVRRDRDLDLRGPYPLPFHVLTPLLRAPY